MPRLSSPCSVCQRTNLNYSRKEADVDLERPRVCRSCQTSNTKSIHSSSSLIVPPPPPSSTLNKIKHPKNFGYLEYIDHLFSLECFHEIVGLKVFPTAKDMTESYGVIKAYMNLAKSWEGEKKGRVKCLVVGDGSTSRTGVLCCYLMKGWECCSIDPQLSEEWVGRREDVRGLVGFKGTFEEFMEEEDWGEYLGEGGGDELVILMVHSHARLTGETGVHRVRARLNYPRTTVVALPCCPGFRPTRDLGRKPDFDYDDYNIFSDKRHVGVWTWEAGGGGGKEVVVLCGEVGEGG
ncbi:hypothetical protein TrST_g9257 [Triparma strigata]|uniref:Uncharacterized protein n=1 Tax=Triparma strigata TaxID=1606541 RepID=A0A9W7EYU6_9STRA|nr:hypothetical protein TrST_g9257 [Triparma strigata]